MRACLDSVTSQTYRPIEHIIVDGGSSDGTLELVKAHRPSHPLRWISEPDGGMYDAINKGISMAHGEVLAYLNSDDLYLPWSVDVAVRALFEHDAELIYGDMGLLRSREDGRPGTFNMYFYPDFDLRYFAFVDTIGQPTVFWRRSLAERIGPFDTRYRLIGDCDYWLRASLAGATPRHISELLALQVDHSSTLRALHAAALWDEFKSMRLSMSAVVKPPPSLRWERVKNSLLWRTRQIEFFLAMKGKRPRKWRHFVHLLHDHGIEIRLSDLRMIAPARWRGDASLFGDARYIYEIFAGDDS
jgi:glycosyltransferase involved in cell wall biosynthesis